MGSAGRGHPAVRPLPVSGVTDLLLGDWRMLTDPLDGARRQYARHGEAVNERWGVLDIVNLYGPDANELVLHNRDDLFSSKQAWDFYIGRIFPDGLMLRDGDDHRLHRRLMQAGFKKPALESYLATMNPLIGQRLDELARRAPTVHAYPFLKLMTLDLAWHVFVGAGAGTDQRPLNRAFETAVDASMALLRTPVPPFLLWRGMRARQFLLDCFRSMLPRKRAGDGSDMFSILARAEDENGRRYSDQEVLDHMVFLMMAAHDTTTSTLTSMLYAMGSESRWQECCRDEVNALGHDVMTFDDQDALPLCGLVMKEALRRYPPLPVMPRRSTRPFEFHGYRIRAGQLVAIHPIHTHHMDEYWREPFRFDPERFGEARAEHRQHKFLWVPFGGGAHMCLGLHFAEMQVKAVLTQLLPLFRWSVREDYRMPVRQAPISKPRDGLPLVMHALRR